MISMYLTFLTEKPYKKHINRGSLFRMGGTIAETFGSLLEEIWNGQNFCVVPRQFKEVIQKHAYQFSDCEQQDSIKLLEFLLDGLHKDLNLVKKKPYVDMGIETEGRDDEVSIMSAATVCSSTGSTAYLLVTHIMHG